MIRPASSQATWRTRRTWPVSVSTSTTATWAPNGNVGAAGLEARRRSAAARRCSATPRRQSAHDRRHGRRAGDVEARRRRVSSTMSASSASSASAASALAMSTSSTAALSTAAPPCCSEREPIVPPPAGTRSVSPHTSSIAVDRDAGLVAGDHRPRRVVALAVRRRAGVDDGAAVVERPRSWPSRRIGGTPPVISTYMLTPMPSCTGSPDSRRRACSARSSA